MESLERREMLHGEHILEATLIATDFSGTEITQITSGEEFLLTVEVSDTRATPRGVFAAFFDISYDSFGFSVNTDLPIFPDTDVHPIPGELQPDLAVAGLINDVGASNTKYLIGGLPPNPSVPTPWFSIPMIAGDAGIDYDILLEAKDSHPLFNALDNITLLHLNNLDPLLAADIHFNSTQLTVVSSAPALAPPPANFEFRVVKNPTAVDAENEVATLPTNEDSFLDFDNFYVEVYAQAPAGSFLQGGHVTLEFEDENFSFVGFEKTGFNSDDLRFDPSYTEELSTSESADISFRTIYSNSGDDNYALLGRALFTLDAPNDPVDDYIKPLPSMFHMTDADATVIFNASPSELTTIPGAIADEDASFEIWPVMYDTDDNGSIGLSDLIKLVSNFGSTVNSPATLQLDFNHDSKIGLQDLLLMVNNFGLGRGEGSQLVFSPAFPSQFLIPDPLPAPLFAGLLEGEPIDVAQEFSPTIIPITETPSNEISAQPSTMDSAAILPLETNSPTGNSSLDTSSSSDESNSNLEQMTQQYQVFDLEAEPLILDSLNDEVELLVADDQEDTDAIDSVLAEFENGQEPWVL